MRVGAALLLVELSLAVPAQAASVSDAQSLYDRNQVADAQAMFAAIAGDPASSADDRSEAERQLAHIDWLIDGNAASALRHLAAAEKLHGKPCSTAALTARVLRESNADEDALRRAPELLGACSEPDGVRRRSHAPDRRAARPRRAATRPPRDAACRSGCRRRQA